MTLLGILFVGIGVLALADALVLVSRRWDDQEFHIKYGGRIAFIVHVCFVTALGVILICAVFTEIPIEIAALGIIGLAFADLVFGLVARRSTARRA